MNCCFCGRLVSKQLTLYEMFSLKQVIKNQCCKRCYLEIVEKENHSESYCYYCQKGGQFKNGICLDCQEWQKEYHPFFLKHDYLYEYNQKMKEYFQLFKFIGDIKMSFCFSRDINNKLISYQRNNYLIIPIPISKERLKERGFNQVEELLKASHINYQMLLQKNDGLESQSEKSKEERLCSEQPFFLPKRNKRLIREQNILLVDDVYTTGRTLLHAYNCILDCKPNKISSFSLSR